MSQYGSCDNIYKVKAISDCRDCRKKNKKYKKEYLVQWVGYDSTYDTWEPASNIGRDTIKIFHSTCKKCFTKSMVTDVRHAAIISPGSGQAVVTGAGKAVVTSAGKAAVTGAEQAVVTNDRQAALHQLVDYNVDVDHEEYTYDSQQTAFEPFFVDNGENLDGYNYREHLLNSSSDPLLIDHADMEDNSYNFDEKVDQETSFAKHHNKKGLNGRRGGLTYFCVHCLPKEVRIENSRIAQHINRYHNNLLSLSNILGGKSMSEIVRDIKVYSNSQINRHIIFVNCPNCMKAIEEGKVMVHMRKVHSLKANEAKIVLGKSKNNEDVTADMITERGFSQYCSPAFVNKFEAYLQGFGAGGLQPSTIAARISGVKKLLNEIEMTPMDLLENKNVEKINLILQQFRNKGFGYVNRAVVSLSSLVNYLATALFSDIASLGKSASLTMLTKQLELWNKALRKCKTDNNSRLRNKLDDNVATDKEIKALKDVLNELKAIAEAENATDEQMQRFLGASFSFECGNAHRPDIASNATLAEFTAWKSEYLTYLNGSVDHPSIPQFRVHKHKTSNLYGAGRVSLNSSSAEILLKFGERRLKESVKVEMHPYAAGCKLSKKEAAAYKDVSPRLFNFKSFSSVWAQIRSMNSSISELHHTRYRYYIETKSKENLSVEEQKAVSSKLLHLPNVAMQCYQANTNKLAFKGSELVGGLQMTHKL